MACAWIPMELPTVAAVGTLAALMKYAIKADASALRPTLTAAGSVLTRPLTRIIVAVAATPALPTSIAIMGTASVPAAAALLMFRIPIPANVLARAVVVPRTNGMRTAIVFVRAAAALRTNGIRTAIAFARAAVALRTNGIRTAIVFVRAAAALPTNGMRTAIVFVQSAVGTLTYWTSRPVSASVLALATLDGNMMPTAIATNPVPEANVIQAVVIVTAARLTSMGIATRAITVAAAPKNARDSSRPARARYEARCQNTEGSNASPKSVGLVPS